MSDTPTQPSPAQAENKPNEGCSLHRLVRQLCQCTTCISFRKADNEWWEKERQNPNPSSWSQPQQDWSVLAPRYYRQASSVLWAMEHELGYYAWVQMFPSEASYINLHYLWHIAGRPQIGWRSEKWEFDWVFEQILLSLDKGSVDGVVVV
jgi:hypothetical protein